MPQEQDRSHRMPHVLGPGFSNVAQPLHLRPQQPPISTVGRLFSVPNQQVFPHTVYEMPHTAPVVSAMHAPPPGHSLATQAPPSLHAGILPAAKIPLSLAGPLIGGGGVMSSSAAAFSAVQIQNLLQGLSQEQQQQQLSTLTALEKQQQQFQKLKVEDALSYLDKVKVHFGGSPAIYSEFLDIMKEFKSQHIDTPGVIKRVSSLFRGHSDLIVGFNTFLPAGYKIEVLNDMITVHQPEQPVYTLPIGGASAVSPGLNTNNSGNTAGEISGPVVNTVIGGPINMLKSNLIQIPQPLKHLSDVHPQSIQQQLQQLHQQQQQQTLIGPALASVSPALQQPQQAAGPAGQQPVEFNRAIHYVNKIKSRYNDKPDVYRSFLDILHAYQKEQKNIKEGSNASSKALTEAEVYARVTSLFKDQPDLLSEFGQFLPDANGNSGLLGSLGQSQDWYPGAGSRDLGLLSGKALPPNLATNDKSSQGLARSPLVCRRPSANPNLSSQPIPKKMKLEMSQSGDDELNDLEFFEKVKRTLNNDESYKKLIKCINLFNQKVISGPQLMDLIQPFLAKVPEVKKKIRRLLKLRKNSLPAENLSHDKSGLSGASAAQRVRKTASSPSSFLDVDLTTCKKYGIHYRELPVNYVQPASSGKTENCPEVMELNDRYVSFATNLEESGAVSTVKRNQYEDHVSQCEDERYEESGAVSTVKRNQYEDHVSQCEDERYELDMVIDSNLCALGVLTSIQSRISFLPPEEQAKYQVDDNFNGASPTLLRIALERLYGDKVTVVMDGIQKNPHIVLPIVIKRMIEKNSEWMSAKSQFNKYWREQMDRYYLKSLDFQGIKFKQADVKHMRSKSLVKDINTIYEEQQQKKSVKHELEGEGLVDVLSAPHVSITCQFSEQTLQDSVSLVVHSVSRQTSSQSDERQKMKQVLYELVPDLFIACRFSAVWSDEGDQQDDDDVKVKKEELTGEDAVDKPITAPETKQSIDTKPPTGLRLLVANDNWFCFVRLLTLLCERVEHFHCHSERLKLEEEENAKRRSTHISSALQLRSCGSVIPGGYYAHFLDMSRNLLDGNIEVSTYEDQMREMFTIHAYLSFTIDKLVQNIVRQLQHLANKEDCGKLSQLFIDYEEKRVKENTESLDQSSASEYLDEAKKSAPEENLYRVHVAKVKDERRLTFELIPYEPVESDDKNDDDEMMMVDDDVNGSIEHQSSSPMDDIVSISPTPVLLMRNRRAAIRRRGVNEFNKSLRQMLKRNEEPCEELRASEHVQRWLDSVESTTGIDDSILPPEGEQTTKPRDDVTAEEMSTGADDIPASASDAVDLASMTTDFRPRRIILRLVNNRAFIYAVKALPNARKNHKEVSMRLSEKFHSWLDKHRVHSESDAQTCSRWFLGQSENAKDCRTMKEEHNAYDKPPYRTYVKYTLLKAATRSSPLVSGSLLGKPASGSNGATASEQQNKE